jgi:hypothetical protein
MLPVGLFTPVAVSGGGSFFGPYRRSRPETRAAGASSVGRIPADPTRHPGQGLTVWVRVPMLPVKLVSPT